MTRKSEKPQLLITDSIQLGSWIAAELQSRGKRYERKKLFANMFADIVEAMQDADPIAINEYYIADVLQMLVSQTRLAGKGYLTSSASSFVACVCEKAVDPGVNALSLALLGLGFLGVDQSHYQLERRGRRTMLITKADWESQSGVGLRVPFRDAPTMTSEDLARAFGEHLPRAR